MPILAKDVAMAEKNSGLTWGQLKLLTRIWRSRYATWSALVRGRSGESRKESSRILETLVEQGLVLKPKRYNVPKRQRYYAYFTGHYTPPRYKVTKKGIAALRAASCPREQRPSEPLKLTAEEIRLLRRLGSGYGKRWSDLAAGIAGPARQKMRQTCESLLKKGLVWRVLTPSPKGYPRFAYTLTEMGDSYRQWFHDSPHACP